MIYGKLLKAIKQNWRQLKYYVIFAVALYVFSLVMSLLKVNKLITYSIIAVCIVGAIIIYMSRSKKVVENRKESFQLKELIGKHAVAIGEINGKGGKITIDGDEYKAKTADGSTIMEYTSVDVTEVDGLTFVVKEHKE